MEEIIDYEITPEVCDEAITQELYLQVGFKTHVCMLILNTGFEALGSYSPVDVKNVSISLGKEMSRKEAIRVATAHLASINQWKKAVSDIKEAEEKEKESGQPKNKS